MASRPVRCLIVAVTAACSLVPQTSWAESEGMHASAEPPLISDIALSNNGTLRGKVVDANNQPRANAELTVWHEKRPVGKIRSNQKGEFAFSGLRGGVHRVTTEKAAFTCRFWSPNTAPPSAKSAILLVDNPLVTAEQVEGVKQAQYLEPGTEYGSPSPPTQTVGHCSPQNNIRYRKGAKGLCWRNPWVIGGLVATAIAIPVALNGDGDDASGS
jgi:hypothetical protein